jgi:uncharacterized membrane protein
MIRIDAVYTVVGCMFAAIAVSSAFDRGNPRRVFNAAFWGLLAVGFLFGDALGDTANGLLVVALVLIGGLGGLGRGRPATTSDSERDAGAGRFGNWLYAPLLVVPAVTVAGTFGFEVLKIDGKLLVDPARATVVSLALGVVVALVVAVALLRPPLLAPVREARRLIDAVGWAAILPQLLAALGGVFALAGVGQAVGEVFGHWLPLDNRMAAVATYGLGMAAFTMIMGNAFAALPVMMAAIGAPLLIGRFGGQATAIGALGMLCGYCGTLMTPMAAHNIVPTALLGLPPGAVIRAQAPTAILVLLANLALIDLLGFGR